MTNDIDLRLVSKVALEKWGIDITKVNIKYVDSTTPFKVRIPNNRPAMDPIVSAIAPAIKIDDDEDIVFQSDSHFRSSDTDFWLAWGPITKTLAIYFR